MEFTLRHYRVEDTEGILKIINFNILHSTALYDYQTRTIEQQLAILNEKTEKGFPIMVAESGDTIVGFGYYSEFRFREAYQYTAEHSVYVADDCKGKGIGKALLIALMKQAKEQGLHTLIGVIDSENKESIVFHEKHGFKVVGVLQETGFKFDRWLHTVFVQKIL